MLKKLWSYLVLPAEITAFEDRYLRQMNRIGLIFFYLHIPAFMLVAALCGTSVISAFALTVLVSIGPTIAYRTLSNVRAMSAVFGFTAMCMGGLLVHFGQGPMQIEMHFYFFVLLALLAVFGNPVAIIVAAVTVALHHLVLYFVLPNSVFNYEASIWAVLVHAIFVILESTAACFVARSFFDNVIGLEKIVAQRTEELDGRNRDLRLVLNSVGQGFLSIDRRGVMSTERSAIVTRWFGACLDERSFAEYLSKVDSKFAASFELGFQAVLDNFLPMELTIDQLPKQLAHGAATYRFEYRPLVDATGELQTLMVVISDITDEVGRLRSEEEQREILGVFERMTKDRSGFLEFYAESEQIVQQIAMGDALELATMKRHVHTLKGNAGIFGVTSIARFCHELETRMAETGERASAEDLASLGALWAVFSAKLDRLVGARDATRIEIDRAEYDALQSAIRGDAGADALERIIAGWILEPTEKRLARIAEQTHAIADRLQKPVQVALAPNRLRLERESWSGFWSSFVHVVRNALDHGLEREEERIESGKTPNGRIEIATYTDRGQFVVQIADDGRGIDWNTVGEMARERGLRHATREDLVEALFADGFSTKKSVTHMSGRGIGMGAVRRACEERGGVAHISSEPGRGTTLQFRFPLAAVGEAVMAD